MPLPMRESARLLAGRSPQGLRGEQASPFEREPRAARRRGGLGPDAGAGGDDPRLARSASLGFRSAPSALSHRHSCSAKASYMPLYVSLYQRRNPARVSVLTFSLAMRPRCRSMVSSRSQPRSGAPAFVSGRAAHEMMRSRTRLAAGGSTCCTGSSSPRSGRRRTLPRCGSPTAASGAPCRAARPSGLAHARERRSRRTGAG